MSYDSYVIYMSSCSEVVKAPKRSVRDAESDPKHLETEKTIGDLEEQRRELLQELESTSQAIGEEGISQQSIV